MRASPAFQISLHRFGVWRGGLLVFASVGLAVLIAWFAMSDPAPRAAITFVAVLAGSVSLAVAASLARVRPVSLRWDGQAWHLGDAAQPPDAAVSGDLSVAIDLGPWMLLRFNPAGSKASARLTWLPIQRRGIEAQWHAVRCSVYSPRPRAGVESGPGR